MQPKAQRRRASARAARLELRRDAVNKRPVYAGLEGGAYKPLKPQDLEKIHHIAPEVLETIGIGDPTPEVISYATQAGGFRYGAWEWTLVKIIHIPPLIRSTLTL